VSTQTIFYKQIEPDKFIDLTELIPRLFSLCGREIYDFLPPTPAEVKVNPDWNSLYRDLKAARKDSKRLTKINNKRFPDEYVNWKDEFKESYEYHLLQIVDIIVHTGEAEKFWLEVV